jgi:hypothetical protein
VRDYAGEFRRTRGQGAIAAMPRSLVGCLKRENTEGVKSE